MTPKPEGELVALVDAHRRVVIIRDSLHAGITLDVNHILLAVVIQQRYERGHGLNEAGRARVAQEIRAMKIANERAGSTRPAPTYCP